VKCALDAEISKKIINVAENIALSKMIEMYSEFSILKYAKFIDSGNNSPIQTLNLIFK
jgi:hypothetical protein